MKRLLSILLVVAVVGLPTPLRAHADTRPQAAGAPAQKYLQDLTLKSIDSETIRAQWEGNDPPYTVIRYATKGEALLSDYRNGEAPSFAAPDTGVFTGDPGPCVIITNDCYAGFSKDDVYGMASLFPNTEYTIRVTSNSGLMIEKSIKLKKPATYSQYGGKARLYLLKPQFRTMDDLNQNSVDDDVLRFFQANEIDRKLSLETARNVGIQTTLASTITYRNRTPEHSFFIRFFLRLPNGAMIKIYNFYTDLYMLSSASANFTWYTLWTQVSFDGKNITQTGAYTFEMYFDDDFAAKSTVTVY